ncbi:hypothetical protein EZS27_025895 [termite gut metagenome]|uniref:Uncharacterized protein n=1 Tax=termite gut metagenome TaxID=433724 RepID=A0A5J4QSL7_9ZZZZ
MATSSISPEARQAKQSEYKVKLITSLTVLFRPLDLTSGILYNPSNSFITSPTQVNPTHVLNAKSINGINADNSGAVALPASTIPTTDGTAQSDIDALLSAIYVSGVRFPIYVSPKELAPTYYTIWSDG